MIRRTFHGTSGTEVHVLVWIETSGAEEYFPDLMFFNARSHGLCQTVRIMLEQEK